MNEHEGLIEEAAVAIRDLDAEFDFNNGDDPRERYDDLIHAFARAALAVFEKAHTPTDDERAYLARSIRGGFYGLDADCPDDEDFAIADAVLAAGFRRSEVPEPSADDRDDIADEALWDFAGDLLDAWNIEDTNAPSLAEDFRDRFVARFHPAYRPEPRGEPSDAQVDAVKDGVSRLAGMQLMHRYSSFGDPWWDALYGGIARVALRVFGGVR